MAAGSQKWVGNSADLETAPARISTSATSTVVEPRSSGAASRTPEIRKVPAALPSITRPTSIARPPAVVMMSACRAARRAASLVRE